MRQHPPAVEALVQGCAALFAVVLLLDDVRAAARVLQKRVLCGSALHWAHVPGPLMHGFVFHDVGRAAG